jgi:hypothetical protein
MEADNKQITHQDQKKPEIISFFDKDSTFVFVFKKTERLASAIYMVTSLFADSEPMKWTLRSKSSELVSFIVNFKDIPESGMSDFVYNAKTKILEIVSLLEISERGGLLSHMNFSILKQEFVNLSEVLSHTRTSPKLVSHESISRSFFDVDSTNLSIKDKSFYAVVDHSHQSGFSAGSRTGVLKDTVLPKSEFKRSNRQNIILGLLKKKKELTIKDIAQVIKDCSEKTIQRELISFMAAGVLKRTGERRWSKYSLM